jgi:multisubunit Na+/H+ antiporter MnhE subunit
MKQSKRQLIDSSLFLYGGLVAFTLTGIAFTNLKSTTSIITLILFLPVSLYFLVRIILSIGKVLQLAINSGQKGNPYFGNFSLTTFFGQTEISFLTNLTLLTLVITLILFRVSFNILK